MKQSEKTNDFRQVAGEVTIPCTPGLKRVFQKLYVQYGFSGPDGVWKARRDGEEVAPCHGSAARRIARHHSGGLPLRRQENMQIERIRIFSNFAPYLRKKRNKYGDPMLFRTFFCMALLVASSAKADEFGIEIITDALSYAVTCTQITYDIDKLNALADKHHVDMSEGSADIARMLVVGEKKRLSLAELPMTTVCTDGLNFYGPKGSKHPGLLWK